MAADKMESTDKFAFFDAVSICVAGWRSRPTDGPKASSPRFRDHTKNKNIARRNGRRVDLTAPASASATASVIGVQENVQKSMRKEKLASSALGSAVYQLRSTLESWRSLTS